MYRRDILLPVKGGKSNAIDDICRDIVEDQRLGRRLQREVCHQSVVGEDFHLEPGEVPVQLRHGGRDPGHHRARHVHQLKLHIGWSNVGNWKR